MRLSSFCILKKAFLPILFHRILNKLLPRLRNFSLSLSTVYPVCKHGFRHIPPILGATLLIDSFLDRADREASLYQPEECKGILGRRDRAGYLAIRPAKRHYGAQPWDRGNICRYSAFTVVNIAP